MNEVGEAGKAGDGEENCQRFRVLSGEVETGEERTKRRWRRPDRRPAAMMSMRRPFRWGRGRREAPSRREAGKVRNRSLRKRIRRGRRQPLRTLEREVLDRLRRTASENEYDTLVRESWQMLQAWGRSFMGLLYEPNGGTILLPGAWASLDHSDDH